MRYSPKTSLKTHAFALIRDLNRHPELMSGIRPPKEPTELTKKPKSGEKIHSPKPKYNRSIDFEAVDMKVDLEKALEDNDHEAIAISYYALAYLLGYL